MSVERCSTCRHWDTDMEDGQPVYYPKAEQEAHNYGVRVPLPGEWGDCQRIRHRADEYEDDQPGPDDLAFLSDGSGYFASISTRAEFGCVLWEPKEPTTSEAHREP